MLDAVRVNSLGFRTDLMLRLLEGGQAMDHGDYLTLHSPQNPMFWWGNFLLMPESALHDQADRWMSRFARAFPGAEHMAIGVDGTVALQREPARAWLRTDVCLCLALRAGGTLLPVPGAS
jgi:hypothetical protein